MSTASEHYCSIWTKVSVCVCRTFEATLEHIFAESGEVMVHGGVKYPSVYVVDSHVTRPPLPPRLTRDQHQQHQYQYQDHHQQQQQNRLRPAQTLLFLLVCLALSGMVIEACFIYRLYQINVVNSQTSSEKSTGGKETGEEMISPTTWHGLFDPPSKPVAHLTDGMDVVHKDNILRWSTIAQPLLYKMDYTDGRLVVHTEGYYYVYSKVSFYENRRFHHSIQVTTNMYAGKSIPLLESRSYTGRSNKIQSNSYLGGVFHLYKDDAIFVQVSNTSQVVRSKAYENVFGVVMI